MFFIRYWYVRAKLALAPNRYTPAEKVALAHEDIDVAKTIILDPSKRVHAGNSDNSLSNNQLVEILHRIHSEELPLASGSPNFRKSFWGKLNALNKPSTFPTFESLIPEYDANNLESNRKASESLVEMGLLDLKILAPEHKVKLAKNSEALAKKIFFGSEKFQNQNIKYIENLQSTHRAEIMSHYYSVVPAAVANIEAIDQARDSLKVPEKTFWERLIYFLMEPKNPDYKARREATEKRISEADDAIKLAEPMNFNKKASKEEKATQIAFYQTTKTTQEQSKAEAMREFYTYLDNADKLNDKAATRLDICLYILQNSPSSGFFKKHINEIVSTIEQNQDFRTRFVALLKSEDAKRPQQGEKLDGIDLREMTSLYNEVIKIFDVQLQVFLSNSPGEAQPTLNKLSFADICDVYQSSQENKYFDNLLLYIGSRRLAEVLPNLNAFIAFLSVVSENQLNKFLIYNFKNIDIFKLISKFGTTLTDEKYENLVKHLVSKLTAAQIVEMLFKNYKDAAILKFLGSARSHIDESVFNTIVIELFNKYDPSQLLELISICKNNEQQLSAIKTCFEIVEIKTKKTVIDADYTDVAKFFMANQLVAQFFNIQLKPEQILKAAYQSAVVYSAASSSVNDNETAAKEEGFINSHSAMIVNAAAESLEAANCLNTSEKLSNLLINYATVVDFPLTNQNEATDFFKGIVSKSYSVVNFELDQVNRIKAAAILNCSPDKLQNALLIFHDQAGKNSFQSRLLAHGILIKTWEELHSFNTPTLFHNHEQFSENMATPKNIIVPLPDPTKIYSIFELLHGNSQRQKLVYEAPFSKAANEAKEIIASVMKLGKSIADKIFKLAGITELFAINFAPPAAAISKSAPAAATPPRNDSAKGTDNKEKDKKTPVRTEALRAKPAAGSPAGNGNNAASPARPPKGDNGDSSPPAKAAISVVGGAVPSAPAVSKQTAQDGGSAIKNAASERIATDPKDAASDGSLDLAKLVLEIDKTLAEVSELTGEKASSQPVAPSSTTPQITGEQAPSTPATATPAKGASPSAISSPLPSASPASASPSSALSPSQQSGNLIILPNVDTITKTSAWLKQCKANPEAYRLAFTHIKELTAKSFSESELISFIAELDLTNRAILLIELLENNNVLQKIWDAKSGVYGFRTSGSKLILKAAKHDTELTTKLYPIKDFADKYHEYLEKLKASEIIELLAKNWNNVLFRDIVVNFISSQKKTLNLPHDNQEFATLLSTNVDVAVKILSRQTIVKSVFLSNFARNNIQEAIKLFRKDNTEQLSNAFLQQLTPQELNIVLAACWKDEEKRNNVVNYLNSKQLSLMLYLDDKILAGHLVANLNYVIQHNLLHKDNIISTFLKFGKDFIKQHWLKLFKFAVDNKCNIDDHLFKDLTISKEDIAQLQSNYATIALDNVDKQNVAKLFNDPILLKSEFTLVKFTFNSENDRKKAAACLGCNPDQLANAYMLFSSKALYENALVKLKANGLEQDNHFESIEIYRNLKEASNKIISDDGNDPISKALGNNPTTFLVPYPDIKYLAHLTSYLNSSTISNITQPVLTELRSVLKLSININLKVTARLYYFTDEDKLEEIGVKSILRPSLDHIEGKSNISTGISKTLPIIENDTKEAMQARYRKADKDSTAIEAIQILIDDLKYHPQNQISPVKKLALLTKLLTKRESDLEAGKNFVKWFIRNCQLVPSPVDIHRLALAYRNASREKNHVNQQLHDAYKKCLEFVIQNEDLQAALTNDQLGEIIREYIYLPNNIQYLFEFLGLKFNAAIKTEDIKLANKECVLLVRTDMAAANLGDNKQEQINASQIIDNARKQLLAIYELKEKVFGKAPLVSPIDFERSVNQAQRAAEAAHPSAQSRAATTLFAAQPSVVVPEDKSSARSTHGSFEDYMSDMQSSNTSSGKDDASLKQISRTNGV